MPISDDERSKKNLKRYFDNQVSYNERQKKYFNEVWYPKNKEKVLQYQKIYRELNKNIKKNPPPIQRIITKNFNISCLVSFD
jgi:hypothetical protein